MNKHQQFRWRTGLGVINSENIKRYNYMHKCTSCVFLLAYISKLNNSLATIKKRMIQQPIKHQSCAEVYKPNISISLISTAESGY